MPHKLYTCCDRNSCSCGKAEQFSYGPKESSEEFFERLKIVQQDYERLMKAKRGDYQKKPKPVQNPDTNVIIGPWTNK